MAEVDNNWSPEYTAYKLTLTVIKGESEAANTAATLPDRQYLLDTYAECLTAVQGKRPIAKTFVRAG